MTEQPGPPRPWTDADPLLDPGVLGVLDDEGNTGWSPALLARHLLVTGETGSGKTVSAVEPVLSGLLAYAGKPMSLLVIDPKHELLARVRAQLAATPERLVVLREAPPVAAFEDYAALGRPLSNRQRVECLMRWLAPELLRSLQHGGDNAYWERAGFDLMVGTLDWVCDWGEALPDLLAWLVAERPVEALEPLLAGRLPEREPAQGEWVYGYGYLAPEEYHRAGLPRAWWDALLGEGAPPDEAGRAAALHLLLRVQDAGLPLRPKAFEPLPEVFRTTLAPLAERLADDWLPCVRDLLLAMLTLVRGSRGTQEELALLLERWRWIAEATGRSALIKPFLWMANAYAEQAVSYLNRAVQMVSSFCDPDLLAQVRLMPTGAQEVSSVRDWIEQGRVVVYQPSLLSGGADEQAARIVKRLFFRFTFLREDTERGVAYVCDEFQRFISGDPESGEQSYLDRCRAYRGICVLATQSIASLRYALLSGKGASGDPAPDQAIQVLLNTIGNRMHFRSTDPQTREILRQQIPEPTAGDPHVLAARPMATLSPGECYYLLANGAWGRRRIALAGTREGSG
jgi:hypothetical protein